MSDAEIQAIAILAGTVLLTVLIPVMQELGWFKKWPVWLVVALLWVDFALFVWAAAIGLKVDIETALSNKPIISGLVLLALVAVLFSLIKIAQKVQHRSAWVASAPHANLTPEEICEQYRNGSTSVQSEKRVKHLIGQSITVAGRFINLQNWATGYRAEIKRAPSPGILIFGAFAEHWKDRLEGLNPGEEVLVSGILNRVFGHSIDMENCEFTQPSSSSGP